MNANYTEELKTLQVRLFLNDGICEVEQRATELETDFINNLGVEKMYELLKKFDRVDMLSFLAFVAEEEKTMNGR